MRPAQGFPAALRSVDGIAVGLLTTVETLRSTAQRRRSVRVPLLVAWLALAGRMMCALRSRVMEIVDDWEKEGLRMLASVWEAVGSWSDSASFTATAAAADSGAGERKSAGVGPAEECRELGSLLSIPSCSLRC